MRPQTSPLISLWPPNTHQIKNADTFVLSVIFFYFSRDFTMDCLEQSKRDSPKWPIFQAQHLFLYLCCQNDTYRAFSIWTYLCLEKKILKLANFIFDISSFKRNFSDFQKKWPKMGGSLWPNEVAQLQKFFVFFEVQKHISCAPEWFFHILITLGEMLCAVLSCINVITFFLFFLRENSFWGAK